MTTIKNFGKIELNTVLITVFLSLLVLFNLFFNNYFIIFLASLVLAGFFIWKTPQAGLLSALLTTIIFGEHFSLLPIQIEDAIYKIYALDFVLLITFVCWILQQKAGSINFKKTIFSPSVGTPRVSAWGSKNLWLLIFLGFIILNFLRGFVFSTDLTLAAGTFKNYIYLLVYFLVIAMVKSKEQILRFLKIFLWGGSVLLLFIIYGWITGHGLWSEVTPGIRYLSGVHSYYLTFSIIILLVLLSYKQYVFGRIRTLGIFLIQLAGMIGGMFRHLWLGILAVFLFILSKFKFKQKKNFVKIGLISFLIIFSIALAVLWVNGLLGSDYNFLENKFFGSVIGRTATIFTGGALIESAAGWRLATWEIALQKFISNPLFGIGFGHKFFFEYRSFVDLIDIRNIHNDFASLLVQLGLLGFIPFVMFNFYQIKDLFRLLNTKTSRWNKETPHRGVSTRPLALILSGFYIISIFGIFFGIYLMFNGTSIFYWSVMALITANIKLKA